MSFGEEAEEEEEMVNQVSQVLKYKSLWLAASLIVVQLFKYLKKKNSLVTGLEIRSFRSLGWIETNIFEKCVKSKSVA